MTPTKKKRTSDVLVVQVVGILCEIINKEIQDEAAGHELLKLEERNRQLQEEVKQLKPFKEQCQELEDENKQLHVG